MNNSTLVDTISEYDEDLYYEDHSEFENYDENDLYGDSEYDMTHREARISNLSHAAYYDDDDIENKNMNQKFSSAKLTIPQEFKFSLRKRTSENKTEDTLLQIQQKLFSECTFQPQINPLPTTVNKTRLKNLSKIPFFERAMMWKQKKEENAYNKAREQKQQEESDCSFHPRVNPMIPTNAYLGSTARDTPSARAKSGIHEKLYNDHLKRESKLKQQHEKLKQDRMKDTCTFKPQITKKSARAKPRYMQPKGLSQIQREQAKMDAEQHFSFKPKINKRKVKKTSGANVYLTQPAFERLYAASKQDTSTPRPQSARPRSTLNISVASEAGTPRQVKTRYNSTEKPVYGFGSSSKRPLSARSTPGKNPTENLTSFDDFWRRHQGREAKKQEKLKYIAASMESQHKPHLNRASLAMAKKRGRQSIYERAIAKEKEKKAKAKKIAEQDLKKCTFQPKINRVSKKMQGRTVEEMSQGDYQRAKLRTQERKLQLQKKDDEHSYKPQLNSYKKVQSCLRVNSSDTAAYLKRVQDMEEKRLQKLKEMQDNQKRREMENCTFKPQVHEAPEYISKIAASMALLKTQQSPRGTPSRVTWK